jgi:hypothetical protein
VTDVVERTKVHVQRKVTFWLGPEDQRVVQGRALTYFMLHTVMVRLSSDRDPGVWASGRRCKKDGSFSSAWGNYSIWGNYSMSVYLDDSEAWITRAREIASPTYTDTDEELAMANARLKEAEALLRRWVDRWREHDSPLTDETEAWL